SKIATIESIDGSAVGKAVQDAWIAENVAQCGYCQSGQIMSATALLNTNKHPSDEDIDAAMSGNICRCATYVRIRRAIKRASAALA
ncbi:MAG: 2Fe-2S iron-sulfur cluster-binding protein, partial [Steroidobacter sp.]